MNSPRRSPARGATSEADTYHPPLPPRLPRPVSNSFSPRTVPGYFGACRPERSSYSARRQGIVGDGCVQLSTSYIRRDVADELPILRETDTGPGGMYSRMEEIGYRLHFEETVTCRLPDETEQKQLG